jgi:hypothetical protein
MALRRKTLAASWPTIPQEDLLDEKYPHLAGPLLELAILERQIALQTLNGPDESTDPAIHQEKLAAWYARKDRLRVELADQVPELRRQSVTHVVGRYTEAVARALPEGSALVEFARLEATDLAALPNPAATNPVAHYLAFALPARQTDRIQMFDLGDAGKIDLLVMAWQGGCSAPAGAEGGRPRADLPATSGRDLRAALVDPVMAALPGVRQWLLAPEGVLAQVTFGALPTEDGRRLGDEYVFRPVRTGWDVLNEPSAWPA